MQPWQQVYDPAGNLWLSSLIALLPIAFFFVALAVLRMKGWLAGTITVAIALAVALLFYRMPVQQAFAAGAYGFIYGLWPIAWIILRAVFLYKVSVKTGQFDIIRASILSITEDQRLQMLMVGFCLRRVPGRRGRVRRAGGDHRRAAGRAGLQSALCRRAVPDRQHRAGGLRRDGHSDHRRRAGHRPGSVRDRPDGRPPAAVADDHRAVLDHGDHGRLARRARKPGRRCWWPAASFAIAQYFTSNFIGPELPDITSALVVAGLPDRCSCASGSRCASSASIPKPGGGRRTGAGGAALPHRARSSRPGRRS